MFGYVLAVFLMGFMCGVGVAYFLTLRKMHDLVIANALILKTTKDIIDCSGEDQELMRRILEELERSVESKQ